MATDIIMPQLGESIAEGTIVKWLVATGTHVEKDQALLEVETDKVALDVPSPGSGTLTEILIQEGETVPVGTPLARLESESSNGHPASTPNGALKPTAQAECVPRETTSTEFDPHQHLSPAVKQLAKEHGVDLSQVTGTGAGGRVTKRDILAFMSSEKEIPDLKTELRDPSFVQATAPAEELVPLTTMRQTIAERMVESGHTSAHVTTVFEVDFSGIDSRRQSLKLTYLPFVAHAVARALKTFPILNSSWSDAGIVMKREINIGIAVALENGLLVPVIRRADQKEITQLGKDITDLAQRARSKQLNPEEVQGGTFTITNHGSMGSLLGTPIINQPEVAILGVGAIQKRPVVINDGIAIRPMAYLSLSFDHRMIDGATADQFMQKVKQFIESQEQ